MSSSIYSKLRQNISTVAPENIREMCRNHLRLSFRDSSWSRVQRGSSAETISHFPSLIVFSSIGLDFKIPQELLIIKSLISPDSAESILLSYLISICIMPPVSQSFHFRGQGVRRKLKTLSLLSQRQFFVEGTIIITEID